MIHEVGIVLGAAGGLALGLGGLLAFCEAMADPGDEEIGLAGWLILVGLALALVALVVLFGEPVRG